jgi:hypothetical protein
VTRHVALMGEARFQRHQADGPVASRQQLPCPLDAAADDVLMQWQAGAAPEQRFKMGEAQSCNLRQLA